MHFALFLLNRTRWLSTIVEIQVMWLDFLLCLEQERQNILYTGLFSPWLLDPKLADLSLDSSSEVFWVQREEFLMFYRIQELSLTVVLTGITRSIDPRDTLSVLHSAEDQDCLRGPHQRSPLLFGVDFVSGCTLRQDVLTRNNIDGLHIYLMLTCLIPADWRMLLTALCSFKLSWMFWEEQTIPSMWLPLETPR